MNENNSFGDTFQEKIEECEAVIRHAVKGKFPHEQALDELVGYAKSQQRTWVGLTDEEIEKEFGFIDELLRDCIYRTEAKLKAKNERLEKSHE